MGFGSPGELAHAAGEASPDLQEEDLLRAAEWVFAHGPASVPHQAVRYVQTLAQHYGAAPARPIERPVQALQDSPGAKLTGKRIRRLALPGVQWLRRNLFGMEEAPFAEDEWEQACEWMRRTYRQGYPATAPAEVFQRREELIAEGVRIADELANLTGEYVSFAPQQWKLRLLDGAVEFEAGTHNPLALLASWAPLLAELCGVTQDAIARWIFCGTEPEVPHTTVRIEPVPPLRRRGPAQPGDWPIGWLPWEEQSGDRGRQWTKPLRLRAVVTINTPELSATALRDLMTEVRSAWRSEEWARGRSRTTADDLHLWEIMERLGATTRDRQPAGFWQQVAAAWTEETGSTATEAQLRKRWSRLRRKR